MDESTLLSQNDRATAVIAKDVVHAAGTSAHRSLRPSRVEQGSRLRERGAF